MRSVLPHCCTKMWQRTLLESGQLPAKPSNNSMTTPLCAEHWNRDHDHSVNLPQVTKWLWRDEVRAEGHQVNSGVLSGEVQESFWERYEENYLVAMLQNNCDRTNENKDVDRVVVRDTQKRVSKTLPTKIGPMLRLKEILMRR